MALAFLLHTDIIADEILIRLPIKSVIRFRSVCKLWNSLCSNLSFVQNHFKYTTCVSQQEDDEYLLVHEYVDRCGPLSLMILSRRNLSQSPISKLPYTFSSKNHIHFVGSINGLICLVDIQHYHFILWNPTIHWFRRILIPTYCRDQWTMPNFFGFGWDSSANDYKLVAKPFNLVSTMGLVYSCKTNTYQQVVSYLPCLPHSTCVIVRGIPYWKSIWTGRVLLFDVRINEFTFFEIPHGIGCEFSLINLNDSLALVDCNLSYCVKRSGRKRWKGGACVVYRFDEQNSTWSKIYTINTAINTHVSMCFKNGGEFLLNRIHKLYDPKSNEIKSLPGYCGRSKTRLLHGISYTPTMLALRGMKPFRSSQAFDDNDGLASYNLDDNIYA